MLGVGFDAAVVHRLPIPLKRVMGRGAHVLQSLRELARYKFEPIRVRIDGHETQAASVIVSKGVFYAGRYVLAPGAEPGRPGFTVVLFDHCGPAAALLYGAALPLNLLSRAPGVRRLHAERVDVVGNARAQADGDPAGCVPLHVTDAAASIEVVIG